MSDSTTVRIQRCLDRLHAHDDTAREELIRCACGRLEKLTHRSLKRFPGVRRWEQTLDVLQNAMLRLHRALATITPATPRDFFQLAAKLIRRELIDLLRHYQGPRGHGARHDSVAHQDGLAPEPVDHANEGNEGQFSDWTRFHECIERMPAEERLVFDLMWYHSLTQAEAGAMLGVSERTVKRRWREARIRMREMIGAELLD